ncbi:LuxR C-terminal-related transcriptional regulator [Citrobacter freundii]|uniref:LuxR C-terminal-related transcriptional regulator n=1 Tax=Citrobacter freundii TaxID=546 RepID=UPI002433562E|nr:LuxR C-terminal-related transcriptional regulator [Citrobacter freundii]WFV09252.1 LuxR C-terminal-related transcriptional regulator [Citrobacter freundii]
MKLQADRKLHSYHDYVLKKITPYILFLCTKKHRLSPKEIEIIAIIVSGTKFKNHTSSENRSLKTLSAQKRSAYLKIGVSNDVELMHYFYWLSDQESISNV